MQALATSITLSALAVTCHPVYHLTRRFIRKAKFGLVSLNHDLSRSKRTWFVKNADIFVTAQAVRIFKS